jgi:hypothetical protein
MSALRTVKSGRRPPLSVRLNDREYALLRQRAGNLPLSTYVKQAALGTDAPVSRQRNPPSRDQRILGAILAALGQSRLPGNLNQLAKAVQSGSLPVDATTQRQIAQACEDVGLIRTALLMALGVQSDHPVVPGGHTAPAPSPHLSGAFNSAHGGRS